MKSWCGRCLLVAAGVAAVAAAIVMVVRSRPFDYTSEPENAAASGEDSPPGWD